MAKYMLKKPDNVGDDFGEFGKVYNIKKFKKPVKLSHTVNGKKLETKFKYVEVGSGELYSSKKQINKKFSKGTFKKPTIKYIVGMVAVLGLFKILK